MIKKLALITLVLTMLGCSNQPSTIEERSVVRWTAVINSEYEVAYDYFTPAYRTVESVESFKLRMSKAKLNIEWLSAVFNKKECDEVTCEVVIDLTYKYQFPRKSMGEIVMETKVNENWIKKGNDWYFLPKEEGIL